MSEIIAHSLLDVSVRKAQEFILAAHRHAASGRGLYDASSVRIAAIELRKYINKIIETEHA